MKLGVALVVLVGCSDGGSSAPDAAVAPDAVLSTTTALTATMNSTRMLDNAGYGVNANGSLHVEVHRGGFTGCPEMNSPTPDYTLVVGSVMPAGGTAATASFIDFLGDMLDNVAPTTATDRALTSVDYVPDAYLSFDADLTFPEGSIQGHVYAVHCTSLDG